MNYTDCATESESRVNYDYSAVISFPPFVSTVPPKRSASSIFVVAVAAGTLASFTTIGNTSTEELPGTISVVITGLSCDIIKNDGISS